MKHIPHLLSLILLCLPAALGAQTARLYDSGTGLPNTQINDVFQDRGGLLWVATSNGLFRYDGVHFQAFHHQREKDGTLASDMVLKVFEDSRGVMWVGTSTALQVFKPDGSGFSMFTLDGEAGTNYIYVIDEVPLGNGRRGVLVSSSGDGMYLIDAATHETDMSVHRKFLQPDNSLFLKEVFVDSKSRIWASSEMGGLYVFGPGGDLIMGDIWDEVGVSLQNTVIATAFAEDPATGDILIGTFGNGILIYRENEGRLVRPADKGARECRTMSLLFTNSFTDGGKKTVIVGTENEGLKLYSVDDDTLTPLSLPNVPFDTGRWKVHDLLEDSQGNLWVSAYQTGLMIVPRSMFGFRHYSFVPEGGAGKDGACLTSVCRDRKAGCTWIGSDGNGIYRFAGGVTDNFNSSNSGLSNNSVMGLAMDSRGTLWIATFMGGLVTYSPQRGFRSFREQDGIGTERTFCLAYDEDRDLMYVGTHGSGVVIVDAAAERIEGILSDDINNWVNSLTFDSSGTLWIGTYDGHWCYDPSEGRVFRASDLGGTGLLDTRTYYIAESKDGTIWMGTGEGLVRLDRRTGAVRVYTDKDGLSNNVISSILEGDDGSIWVSTSYGLTRIDPSTGKCSRYYAHDGLQGNEFRSNAAYKSPRGQLFFGGTNGMTAFYPQAVDRRDHDVPPVIFTGLTVANEEVEYNPDSEDNILDKDITEATAMVLPYSSNSFSLEYAVPEFTNPERIRYEYMLRRFDDGWKTAAGDSRTATYTNIPHGRYKLTVRAGFDGDEDSYSTREISVRVLPPWYLSIWALLAGVILLACFLAFFRDLAARKHRAKDGKDAAGADEAWSDDGTAPEGAAAHPRHPSDISYDYGSITMPSRDTQFLSRVIDCIKDHLGDSGFGVEELSREIGMSRVHLNRKLKGSINVSPGTFIKSLRLKQAAYLLVNNKVNISEVAFKVGFSTHSYFSSTFKEYFGLSPKEFVAKYSDPAMKGELDRLLEL